MKNGHMWKAPDNIPSEDWEKLGVAWDKRKAAVYDRFTDVVPDFPLDKADAMLRDLLGAYYRAEINAAKKKSFDIQLKDEFHKAFLVEGMILQLRRGYPAMNKPARVNFNDHEEVLTRADRCMGGIVRAFIEITREVCSDKFGCPYDGKEKALRNGVLERSAWEKAEQWYEEKRRAWEKRKEQNPKAPPPEIYRQ